jgi:hypothetical protein
LPSYNVAGCRASTPSRFTRDTSPDAPRTPSSLVSATHRDGTTSLRDSKLFRPGYALAAGACSRPGQRGLRPEGHRPAREQGEVRSRAPATTHADGAIGHAPRMPSPGLAAPVAPSARRSRGRAGRGAARRGAARGVNHARRDKQQFAIHGCRCTAIHRRQFVAVRHPWAPAQLSYALTRTPSGIAQMLSAMNCHRAISARARLTAPADVSRRQPGTAPGGRSRPANGAESRGVATRRYGLVTQSRWIATGPNCDRLRGNLSEVSGV